jgi:hypothetical protein
MFPGTEPSMLELIEKIVEFEVRLKEFELLAEQLNKINSSVDLLTKSFENFVSIIMVEKKETDGESMQNDIL